MIRPAKFEMHVGEPITVAHAGEQQTGRMRKELVARSLHNRSTRKDGPFVAINCGAVPAEIIESELFGHVAGAFTGAQKPRTGKLEFADGGTVFLDELAELPLLLQAKLLRTLQERRIRRVGGREEVEVDVRIVAATARDLDTMVRQGLFRQDLYYRINVVRIAESTWSTHEPQNGVFNFASVDRVLEAMHQLLAGIRLVKVFRRLFKDFCILDSQLTHDGTQGCGAALATASAQSSSRPATSSAWACGRCRMRQTSGLWIAICTAASSSGL